MRSSSEWNDTTTSRPPGLRTRSAAESASCNSSSSWLTKMRKALKRPRGRMNLARLSTHHLGDEIGQRPGRGDRRFLARGDDRTRHRAGVTLFAEDVDDVGKIGLGRSCDHIRRGRAILPHPHIEGTVGAERKAAPGLVELHRGDADIHHDAVDRGHALRGADFREVGEAVLDQSEAAFRALDKVKAARNRRAIAVDADDARLPRLEDRLAIAARAERRVDIDAPRRAARARRAPRGRARKYDADGTAGVVMPTLPANTGARCGTRRLGRPWRLDVKLLARPFQRDWRTERRDSCRNPPNSLPSPGHRQRCAAFLPAKLGSERARQTYVFQPLRRRRLRSDFETHPMRAQVGGASRPENRAQLFTTY